MPQTDPSPESNSGKPEPERTDGSPAEPASPKPAPETPPFSLPELLEMADMLLEGSDLPKPKIPNRAELLLELVPPQKLEAAIEVYRPVAEIFDRDDSSRPLEALLLRSLKSPRNASLLQTFFVDPIVSATVASLLIDDRAPGVGALRGALLVALASRREGLGSSELRRHLLREIVVSEAASRFESEMIGLEVDRAQPAREEAFRNAIERAMRPNGELSSAIAAGAFDAHLFLLTILHPEYALPALRAVRLFQNRFDRAGVPFDRVRPNIGRALFHLVEDAADQGAAIDEARYSGFHINHGDFVRFKHIVHACTPNSSGGAPLSLSDVAPALRGFWSELRASMVRAGYTREDYLAARAVIEPRAVGMSHYSTPSLTLKSIVDWCQLCGFRPSPQDFGKTLVLLLDPRRPAGTPAAVRQEDPDAPALRLRGAPEEFFEQRRPFYRLQKLLSFIPRGKWPERLLLSDAAYLAESYAFAFPDRADRVVPVAQLIESLTHNPEYDIAAALNELASKDSGEVLRTAERDRAVALSRVPRHLDDKDCFSVLSTALVLGVDHSEFAGRFGIRDISNAFNAADAAGRVAPLASAFVPARIVLPRVPRQSESTLASDASRILREHVEELGYYWNGDFAKRAAIAGTARGRFYDELFALDRCRFLIERTLRNQGNPQQLLFSFVEFAAEGMGGGLNDEIRCVNDTDLRAKIAQELQLDTLRAAVRKEFELHEASEQSKKSGLTVAFIPTRGILTEFSGHICDTCLTRLSNIAADYPDAVFVPFVLRPEATGKGGIVPRFAGGAFLWQGKSADGEPLLVIRGYNPQSNRLKEIRAGDLFEAFADYAAEAARRLGMHKVIVPDEDWWGLACTNRAYPFLHIERCYRDAERMTLADTAVTSFNGITFKRGIVVRTAP